MTELRDVIGLLHRADWTQLSLSAEVHVWHDIGLERQRLRVRVRDDPAADVPDGILSRRASVLIAPGGRFREETRDDMAPSATGHDGEHGWLCYPPSADVPPWVRTRADREPFPELFGPAEMLSGFALEIGGPVTASGRNAVAVTAIPRPGARHRILRGRMIRADSDDRIEMIVDAELGFLLRREERFRGQRLAVTELTAVRLDPPQASDRSRFAPPPGAVTDESSGENFTRLFDGPGWQRAKTAAGLAAGGLGALIRHRPDHRERSAADYDIKTTMPAPDPAPILDQQGLAARGDDVLAVLHRSGEFPPFTATLQRWHDFAAMADRVPQDAREAGFGGVGYLLDSVSERGGVAHTAARILIAGPNRYRIDFQPARGRRYGRSVASDGQCGWRMFDGVAVTGPVIPPPLEVADLIDASWLLTCKLSGGTELTYHGRPAYQLTVRRARDDALGVSLAFFPADAIVDAELGCLLRLICYSDQTPISWCELRNVQAQPSKPGDFQIPPGTRIIEETGNPLVDGASVMPGVTGWAARSAVDATRRASGAVSAAKRLLDDLRG